MIMADEACGYPRGMSHTAQSPLSCSLDIFLTNRATANPLENAIAWVPLAVSAARGLRWKVTAAAVARNRTWAPREVTMPAVTRASLAWMERLQTISACELKGREGTYF